ncbi:MBL fold metallo-hydrolase [Thalassotalea crassostreae]|uniref:MBL fold metallo-hydrolase n=1 Tax=Thalassotalea crassostreae TaxID=1763536 RepID=UPI0008385AFF|nr:MBL fold metallo-hydrolase [Thalassotalea crassostreae]
MRIALSGFMAALSLVMSMSCMAARDFSDAEIKAENVAGDVYVLTGPGGNIGVLATDAGLLLVDDKFAPLAEKIEAAMKTLNKAELKYIINTHYHGDHTGSNGYFGKQAPIFAHENVRTRVKEDNKQADADLPVVTYEQGITIHLHNEEVKIVHFPHGHTDGDSIVYFKNTNVLHMGDLFFQGRFPYIDLDHGGSVKGYLANVKKVTESYPSDVVIIPGHGDITDLKGLQQVVAMLEYSIERVSSALAAGKSSEQILKDGIGEKYKDWSWGFINEERWLKTLIKDLG